MTDRITIFCEVDDFCKLYMSQIESKRQLLSNGEGKRKRSIRLTMSEVITISLWYHHSGYATFKDYYTKYVQLHLKDEFPNLVSYSRFIELRSLIIVPTFIFLLTHKMSDCSGISYIDSFKLEACHNKRASSHKTLAKIAAKGKTSVGWFYGLKVHLVINHEGEIIAFYITPGNIADNNQQLLLTLTKNLSGKLFGDKGYLVNSTLFRQLYEQSIHLITKIRSNMKNKLMSAQDKFLLKKRGIIESVGDILKKHLHMEHSRHRSIWGFFLHILTSLTAYQNLDKKPSLAFTLKKNLLPA